MIEIRNLTKQYGEHLAVDDLSLTLSQGDIFGFVGPNGAGKTTTIRMITGLLQPTSGDITISGFPVSRSSREVKRLIGYMPDYFGSYPSLKVWEYLDFFSACYDIPEKDRPARIRDLMELVDLAHRREDMVDQLSRGMKQRLSLARTLIHEPQVLILDEPASGLDPRARVEIRELLVELANMGKTIFFSSHILADVSETCNRVGIIEAGKLVATGTLEELHLKILPYRNIEVTLLDRLEPALELLRNCPGVASVQSLESRQNGEYAHLFLEFYGDDQALSQVLAVLVQNNFPVLRFNEDRSNLEEVFMHATKGLVT